MKHDLMIIGGGAAGLIAAITAKDRGIDVAILERNDRLGKKILSTGNGRCNITNENISMKAYHSENSNFSYNILKSFDYNATKDFFMSIGLPLLNLENGKVFPMSLQASSVLDIFRIAINEKNIPVYLNSKITEIIDSNKKFLLIDSLGNRFESKCLILATGGMSAPQTGSDGSGYILAKKLGHKILTPLPALVQLKLSYKNLKALSGVKFDGSASIFIDGKNMRNETGEILFTDYGISGPAILQLSRIASSSLIKGNEVFIKIDLIPNFSNEYLENFLENHWATFFYRSTHDSLIGIIHKKLIPILLKDAGIESIHKPCSDLDWKEKKNILQRLKNWQFEVIGTNSFKDAQITAGGVDTNNINANTLESKILPNLYFAGEIIDVDGDCGGYNLQWAWSSGFQSAISASNSLNKK